MVWAKRGPPRALFFGVQLCKPLIYTNASTRKAPYGIWAHQTMGTPPHLIHLLRSRELESSFSQDPHSLSRGTPFLIHSAPELSYVIFSSASRLAFVSIFPSSGYWVVADGGSDSHYTYNGKSRLEGCAGGVTRGWSELGGIFP